MAGDKVTSEQRDQMLEAVDRAKEKVYSRQGRFTATADEFFGAVYSFMKEVGLGHKAYKANTRERDRWLRDVWPREPHWAAVLKTCAALDKNRPWSMTGGRNQVYRYTPVLLGALVAPDVRGWRPNCEGMSMSFRTSDLGAVQELGRDGKDGPLRELAFVDPTRCMLTGNVNSPLKYFPPPGGFQEWGPTDYFRVASMISTDERMRGAGFCATSMAVELVRLFYGVLMHDQEELLAKMPEGLLLLKGIGQEQWNQALEARKMELEAENRYRFGGVMVLATSGDSPPEARLEALSTLPAQFDRKIFMDYTMYGYALIVNRDPSEFWPIQTGSIGRGNEPDIQHRKATRKGGADFTLEYQEKLQGELPDTLLFEFDDVDVQGQLEQAEVAEAWVKVVNEIQGDDLQRITTEQYLSYLVEKGVAPPEWTELEEDVEATDTDQQRVAKAADRWRELVLSRPDIRRAVAAFPSEQIIEYRWAPTRMRETILFERGADALVPKVWRVARIERQEGDDEGDVLFEDGEVVITEDDVDRAIADAARRVPGDGGKDDPGMAAFLTAQELVEEMKRRVREGFKRWLTGLSRQGGASGEEKA